MRRCAFLSKTIPIRKTNFAAGSKNRQQQRLAAVGSGVWFRFVLLVAGSLLPFVWTTTKAKLFRNASNR